MICYYDTDLGALYLDIESIYDYLPKYYSESEPTKYIQEWSRTTLWRRLKGTHEIVYRNKKLWNVKTLMIDFPEIYKAIKPHLKKPK